MAILPLSMLMSAHWLILSPIDVEPDLKVSKVQLLDAILHELSSNGFNESEEADFWSEMTNLQKAKIIR